MTMIERVARALCPEEDGPGRLVGDDGRAYPAGVPRWRAWETEARAAISAMRDPPPYVVHAIEVKAEERYEAAPNMQRWYGDDVWNAGIDAALSSPNSDGQLAPDSRYARRMGWRSSGSQGTVGNWRRARLVSLDAVCEGLDACGHHAVVPFDPAWPDSLPIRAIRRRLVCRCGRRDPEVIPAWREMVDPPGAWSGRP